MVRIEITDQGSGIPAADLEHIFDPYYTTKREGSGLGLAVVHSIIARHQGRIEVQSELNEGTTFTLFLPASQGTRPLVESDFQPLQPGTGCIMIMDDDREVRLITGRMVRQLGFEVIEADEGGKAIDLYRERLQQKQAVSAVILDLTVPRGMGGLETMKGLLAIDPGCRGVVASGYSNDPVMANHRDFGFMAALVKPFNLRRLSQVLGQVLDQGDD